MDKEYTIELTLSERQLLKIVNACNKAGEVGLGDLLWGNKEEVVYAEDDMEEDEDD